MKEQLSGIILGTVKHSDRHNVTSIFTRERGRMTLLTPAGTSKRSRQTSARLQPLSVVETQVNVSATRDLHIPSAIAPIKVWRTLYSDPLKTSVIMFLSEFLNRLLHDAPPESRLWDFIVNSTALFDLTTDSRAIANFHIAFLVGMAQMMGIYPDISNYMEGMEFDMKAGRMVLPFSLQSFRGVRIGPEKSAYIPILLRINFSNARCFRFTGAQRSDLLNEILKYFGCHFPGCDRLKSPEILKEIFS